MKYGGANNFGKSVLLILLAFLVLAAKSGNSNVRFVETFNGKLDRWLLVTSRYISIKPTDDPDHGPVMVLVPNGNVHALIKGSDRWHGISFDADVLFPTDEQNYLGLIYNFQTRGDRKDFGVIYIKGNGSYLEVNPHRDFNVSRTLYPEYHTPLKGNAAIHIGKWQHFKAEIIRNECHVFVGDTETPQLTFSMLELNSGLVGLKPRSVGGEVWVDNIVISSIENFSYKNPIPLPEYEPQSLLISWDVIGPLSQAEDDIARQPNDPHYRWRPFVPDPRGAILTGTVTDYLGPNTVAYFRAKVRRDKGGDAILHLSTVDDLALWVNGRFHWFIARGEYAWFDFWKNPEHAGQKIPIPLIGGNNDLVLRVRGGVYASGGYFARIEDTP